MKCEPYRELATREVDATPYATSLIEGHRDFGYSLETALSDIIDNSITAGAQSVALIADTAADEAWIAIADDGSGMTEAELIDAMRLGSKNPTHKRAAKDLGRFGLGLKSASFSQCRCLTVLTRRNGKTSCARWDLDRIAQRNEWSLELIDNPELVKGHHLLPETGTVVVWEKLDRLSGGYTHDRGKRAEYMNSEFSRAERHLRLVFHRFLEGTKPRVKLLLNGRRLKPIDPMASSHAATQKDPEEILRLRQGDVVIRCHTLPHHKRMSQEEWDEIGGPEGHLKSQGLYVYREDRLIIAGGWLGLARQTELTKLCRIAVDIPNTMDAEWRIDVKKASAQLPPVVRERLKRVVERFVGTSKRTYRSRGQRLVDETRFPIWNRVQKDGQIVFRPNLEHPIFRSYAEQLPEGLREGFERCLRIVGAGLPIETLHAELVGNAEAVTADETSEHDLKVLVCSLATTLMENGVAAEALPDTLQSNPFLRVRWEAAAQILDDFLRTRVS
ncbi:ATP-binding protein [Oricola thermophila]|uniref:ATP-binding protein n=1 Tax=Oricola thermophila TaxID=2742145 RepID=A0A6N1VM54_9HYPH|nr:ATP-binding protein [Oricola thermophila]QKV20057.1 ATP-binding protein [Oricola thermophila]